MKYTNIPNAIFKNMFDGGHKQCIIIAKFPVFRTDKKR